MPLSEHDSYHETTFLRDRGSLDHRLRGRKKDYRSVYTRFRGRPIAQLITGAAATGSTGDVNQFVVPGHNAHFEYHILGAGQTIIIPTQAATGLLASLDLTNNEGAEYTNGILEGGPGAFKIGTDAAFYFRCGYTIADVSGIDNNLVGFRKIEAYQADHNTYTDLAAIGCINGDIKISTALNDGAETVTDTTDNWADGETHTLEVYVSSAGVVTYKIDGRAPTATAAFTFDSGDVVVPFFHFLHDTTSPGAITLVEWDVAFQESSPAVRWP